jgi:hypothetical protein
LPDDFGQSRTEIVKFRLALSKVVWQSYFPSDFFKSGLTACGAVANPLALHSFCTSDVANAKR